MLLPACQGLARLLQGAVQQDVQKGAQQQHAASPPPFCVRVCVRGRNDRPTDPPDWLAGWLPGWLAGWVALTHSTHNNQSPHCLPRCAALGEKADTHVCHVLVTKPLARRACRFSTPDFSPHAAFGKQYMYRYLEWVTHPPVTFVQPRTFHPMPPSAQVR